MSDTENQGINWRRWGFWSAISAGIGLLATTFFTSFSEALKPLVTSGLVIQIAQAVWSAVVIAWELFVIVAISFGSILVGWGTTEMFKRLSRVVRPPYSGTETAPDGTKIDHDWKRIRLMKCSLWWTFLGAEIFLGIRYMNWPRILFESGLTYSDIKVLLYITGWSIVLAVISMFAFDVVVKDLWPRFRRKKAAGDIQVNRNEAGEIVSIKDLDAPDPKTEIIDRTKPGGGD